MGVLENMAAGRAQFGFGGAIGKRLGDMLGVSEEARQSRANDALFAQSGTGGGDEDGIPVRTSDLVKIFRAKGSSDQDRQLAGQLLEKRLATKNPKAFQAITAGNKLYRFDPNTGQTELAQDFGSEPPSEFDQLKLEEQRLRVDQMRRGPQQDQSEYDKRAAAAVQYGLKPGSPEFQTYVLTDRMADRRDAAQPPAGYRWLNPDNPADGMAPIAGGPGEKIDGEIAGRIGLAKDALRQLPEVKARAEDGTLTGPYDKFKGWMGWGEQGRLTRELAAGSEALTRMLTGAGMNAAEAEREASLYMVGVMDGPEEIASKVDQLQRRLKEVSEIAGRGRGGVMGNQPQQPGQGQQLADPLGIR